VRRKGLGQRSGQEGNVDGRSRVQASSATACGGERVRRADMLAISALQIGHLESPGKHGGLRL
jgi:hypothetical protein